MSSERGAHWTAPRIRKGRGTDSNPANRFERLVYAEEPGPEGSDEPCAASGAAERPAVPTRFFRDASKTLLTFNDSPDLPFDASLNPYRGCEHGCIYCYARPSHEFLGFSAGLDFETRILVKERAAALLRRELAARRWRPQVVALGGVTDVYQPVERRLRITRSCLEVFAECRNPVVIVTKSGLVTRDADLLGELARFDAAAVLVSVTSLDPALQRIMEPRAAPPQRRLETIRSLTRSGVPVGALIAPVVPGLTDHEIPAIVDAVARAGAISVRHVMLRLPHGLGGLFDEWLERHLPDRRRRILGRIRDVRGGQLNDPRFHSRQRGSGPFAQHIHDLFDLTRRRAGLADSLPELSTAHFRRPTAVDDPQLALFNC